MVTSQVDSVRQWLRSTWKVSVPDDWLTACIEWIHSENGGLTAAIDDLCNLVFEQWLVCDLREIGASCLPTGLSQLSKHLLQGDYALQVNSLTDVSCPFYGQLQKANGAENANSSVTATQPTQPAWDPKASRMLMLKLTDGLNEIHGMEYQTIPSLKENLTPGTKIIVHGSVLCRSGVLMLKSNNVTFLGGEVETLAEENTAAKVISDSLRQNIELISNPKSLPKESFIVSKKRSGAANGGVQQQNVAVVSAAASCATPSTTNVGRQATVALIQRDNRRTCEDDDDLLIEMAESVDVMDNNQLWGDDELEFDDFKPMDQNNYDFACRQNQNSKSSSSIINKHELPDQNKYDFACRQNQNSKSSSSIINKHLGLDELPDLAEPSICKKPKTDILSESSRSNVFDGIDFDDDGDFDWQMPLYSVTKSMRCETLQKTESNDIYSKPMKTVASKLRERATVSSQKKKEMLSSGKKQENRIDSFLVPAEKNRRVNFEHSFNKSNKTKIDTITSASNSTTHNFSTTVSVAQILPASSFSSLKENKGLVARVRPTGFDIQLKKDNLCESDDHVEVGQCSDLIPFTYLSCLLNRERTKDSESFYVKAYISTLVSRLEHNQGSHWSLVVKINDGSAALDVQLNDQILTELTGFSAAECMSLRDIAKRDKVMRERLTKGIQHCQETLIQLSTVMELVFSFAFSVPLVRSFHSVTNEDIKSLSKRIKHHTDKFAQCTFLLKK